MRPLSRAVINEPHCRTNISTESGSGVRTDVFPLLQVVVIGKFVVKVRLPLVVAAHKRPVLQQPVSSSRRVPPVSSENEQWQWLQVRGIMQTFWQV